MQYTRAILASIAAYVATFLLSALVLGLVLFDILPEGMSLVFYGIQFVGIIMIATTAAWWYFSGPAVTVHVLHGLLFGLVAVGVSILGDVAIAIPAIVFLDMPTQFFVSIYTNLLYLSTILLFMATTTAVGWLLQNTRQ